MTIFDLTQECKGLLTNIETTSLIFRLFLLKSSFIYKSCEGIFENSESGAF